MLSLARDITCVLILFIASGQTVVGFNISMTNDGHTYSNEITAVRTDSHCADCLKSGTSCTVKSGCQCAHNHALYTCACCDVGGCQCQAPNSNQCVKCGDTQSCGHPLAAPDNGVDGYTTAINDCECKFDPSQSNCGCCREGVGACQCGRTHRHQCVDCDHMDQCGNKPWIFGPPMA